MADVGGVGGRHNDERSLVGVDGSLNKKRS